MRIGLDARHAAAGLGIATFVTSLAEALVGRGGTEVVWLGGEETAPAGVAQAVPPPGPYPVLDGPYGRRWAGALGLDVLHFTGNTGWRRSGPMPTVLTVHDLIFFERIPGRSARQRYGHAYLRWNVGGAVRAATVLAAGSQSTADAVARRFGRQPVALGYGVRSASLVGTPAEPPYLLAFGGRDPRKGLDLALEVARATGLPLHVTGRAGLPSGFVAGPDVVVHDSLPREELDALIAGALALVYLSSHEGFGLPVVEALALGTPVVTGRAPVTREVAGEAGLLVDVADPVGSAVAHVRSLLDPARRAAVAAAGRERARAFSWDAVAERYEALYAEARG